MTGVGGRLSTSTVNPADVELPQELVVVSVKVVDRVGFTVAVYEFPPNGDQLYEQPLH
jgi:hypothetical protein